MQLMKNASEAKLRGGFYTPPLIAKFILKWAVNGNNNYEVLEPSCGDGIFLDQIKENDFKYKSITAIEIDEDEAEKSSKIHLAKTRVINEDFLTYCNSTSDKFDLVIGNPPYIRYQFFNKEQRAEAEKIFLNAGLSYSKLTNAWVSFEISPRTDTRLSKKLWGTYVSLVKSMIKGTMEGFSKKLILEGIGFKAQSEGKDLTLSLGFSHQVKFLSPEGIGFQVEKNTITVNGIDKEKVGETAARLRALKKPDPYKGKGFRYDGEIIRRKAGKKAAGTTA